MIRKQLGTIKAQVKIIERNKEGLRYIISSMPETINRLQPLDKFVRGVLMQLNGFIDAEKSFLATIDENGKYILLVGTGDYDVDEKAFLQSGFVKLYDEKLKRIESSLKPEIGENEGFFGRSFLVSRPFLSGVT